MKNTVEFWIGQVEIFKGGIHLHRFKRDDFLNILVYRDHVLRSEIRVICIVKWFQMDWDREYKGGLKSNLGFQDWAYGQFGLKRDWKVFLKVSLGLKVILVLKWSGSGVEK